MSVMTYDGCLLYAVGLLDEYLGGYKTFLTHLNVRCLLIFDTVVAWFAQKLVSWHQALLYNKLPGIGAPGTCCQNFHASVPLYTDRATKQTISHVMCFFFFALTRVDFTFENWP